MREIKTSKNINFACYTTMILLGLYLASYQNVIDTITKEYSITSSIMGLIIALHFIGSITAPVVFGELSDRKGTKVVTITAFLILIVGLLAVSAFQNIYILALGIFLIGSGFSVIEGTLSTILSNINPGQTVRVVNISQMFFCIGAVLGPLFVLFIDSQFGSWRMLYVILIFMFLLMALAFSRFSFYNEGNYEAKKSNYIEVEEKEERIHSIILLKKKSFILLCLSMFIYVGAEEGIAFWTTTFFKHAYDSAVWGSYALSAYWAGMILGRFLASMLPKKAISFLKIGSTLTCVCTIIALLTNNKVVGFASFSLIGLGFSVAWPMIVSITSDKYYKYKGTAVGIMMSLGAMGGTVFPFLVGLFDNYGKIKEAFWAIPILTAIMLLAILRAEKMEDLS